MSYRIRIVLVVALGWLLNSPLLSKQDFPERIIINHPKIIGVLDGTSKADVQKMARLELRIREIREGDKAGRGVIMFLKQPYTLKQLIALEENCSENHLSCDHLKEAHSQAIKQLEMDLKPYLSEVRNYFFVPTAKWVYCDLINQWASQRHIKTALTECGKYEIDDIELLLKKLAPNLSALDTLLADLSWFLQDFRFSCKKSLRLAVRGMEKKT